MSTHTEVPTPSASLVTAFHEYVSKVKAGDIGSLPAVLGLIALCGVFTSISSFFLTPLNFANLLTQSAGVMVIAMGLIFVLLLGEIDLSAGFAAGVTGISLVLLIVDYGWPWWAAFIASLVIGIILGALIGFLVAVVRIPSFVVTLGAFLAYQGLLLVLAGDGGTVQIGEKHVLALENSNLKPWLSWAFFLASSALYVLITLRKHTNRRRNNLKVEPFSLWLLKTCGLIALCGYGTFELSLERSNNPTITSLKGIPYVVPLILLILVVGNFVLTSTPFGRHFYAVGGNAEAARRAGIDVKRIRIYAFIICSGMTSIAGFIFASRQNSISPTTGGSSTLLYAVGAAVIGGTSLFGGKGKMRDAVLGGLVVAVIDNGMGLLGYSSGIQFMVTGAVLMVSAGVDAISRRGSE